MMKNLLLLAGAAALGIAAPAVAGPGKAKGPKHKGHSVERVMPNQAYGYGQNAYGAQGNRYNGYNCPPGLAKKTPACVPPGQAKKMAGVNPYAVGQVIPQNAYRTVPYNQIPNQVIPQGYSVDPYGRYVYTGGTYYQVDPTTMVIQQVLGSLVR